MDGYTKTIMPGVELLGFLELLVEIRNKIQHVWDVLHTL